MLVFWVAEAAVLCTVAGECLDTWPEVPEAAAAGSRDTFPLSHIHTSCSVGEQSDCGAENTVKRHQHSDKSIKSHNAQLTNV